MYGAHRTVRQHRDNPVITEGFADHNHTRSKRLLVARVTHNAVKDSAILSITILTKVPIKNLDINTTLVAVRFSPLYKSRDLQQA
jgi:hypothetical protein